MGNKNKIWIIVLIFVITGIITGMQFKQNNDSTDIITMRSIVEDQKSVDNEKLEIERLKNIIKELEEKLVTYKSEEYDVDDIIQSLEDELEWNKILAGLKDLEGPGIRIVMKDSEQYADGQNLNNFIIHNSDVLQIINDLRSAGAERIAINGHPIFWGSKIDCNGATIRVENRIFAPPFVIEAIGNPPQLEGVLTRSDGIIELMRLWDIRISISEQEKIIIKGNPTLPDNKYLNLIEEGDDA